MSETHEHLEHAEHAAHGADPFTVRVAMTMAIIAAVLAAIALMGHRKHNETLQLQGDANRLHTEAAAFEVKSSNQYSFHQAKRARVEQRQQAIDYTKLFAAAPNADEIRTKKIEEWQKYINRNSNNESDIKTDKEGFPFADEKGAEDNSPGALLTRGKRYKELAEERTKEADKKEHEYHHVHHQADGLDWAHLSVELGLVLCTICILTKKKEYWQGGILATLVGVGLACYGLFLV